MRSTGLCALLFLNIMFMGMMGYMYLLWVQYWAYSKNWQKQHLQERNDPHVDLSMEEIEMREGRPRNKPRFYRIPDDNYIYPAYEGLEEKTTTERTTPAPTDSPEVIKKKVEKYKLQLTVQLRSYQMLNGKILFKHENRYGVDFQGEKGHDKVTNNLLSCALRQVNIRALRDGDEPFTTEGMSKYFPHEGILEGQHYNSCAIVSSAGTLKGSALGEFIDSHDYVVRFNHAPTKGYEKDVGTKTSFRILNSQVVTKPEFDFWQSPLYQNITLLIWDPSNYSDTLAEWYTSSDFPVFSEYFRRRLMLPKEDVHLLHPSSLWNLWNAMQQHTNIQVKPNPPSSGFLGISLMLKHCNIVNVMEFVPSVRFSKLCHYWNSSTDIGCTFGDWHPLATEKILSLVLNSANDITTYYKGYITLRGHSQIRCDKDS